MMLRTMGLRGALDAATTTHREELAKSVMSQTTLSLDAVSASVHVPYDVLIDYAMTLYMPITQPLTS